MIGIRPVGCIPFVFLLLLVSACARSLNQAPIAQARPVDDWNGIANLSHDGDVYFGGQPTQEALAQAARRGIMTVVNLRTPQEMETKVPFDEEALVRGLDMEYVSIPVAPATLSLSDADRLKEILSETDRPVLVHCSSSNRVGAVWALYLFRHRGFDLEAAIERGRQAGMNRDALIEVVRRVANASGHDSSAHSKN